jgi:hypothetical protein
MRGVPHKADPPKSGEFCLCGAVNNVLSIDILYIGNSSFRHLPIHCLTSKYDLTMTLRTVAIQGASVDIKKGRPKFMAGFFSAG